ncbi:MAG: response regulator transcription factor [Planctomycetes bacterium]|nr:response regulator transcription factor [Planctomycetota bacterium]
MEPCRVAIVDDDEHLARLLSEYLVARGAESSSFRSAEDLLAADVRNFQAVVLDIHLPGIWGSECIFKLRNQGYSGLAIAITGHVDKWDREDLKDLGFDGFFAKPFEPADMVGFIFQNLGNRAADAQ